MDSGSTNEPAAGGAGGAGGAGQYDDGDDDLYS